MQDTNDTRRKSTCLKYVRAESTVADDCRCTDEGTRRRQTHIYQDKAGDNKKSRKKGTKQEIVLKAFRVINLPGYATKPSRGPSHTQGIDPGNPCFHPRIVGVGEIRKDL